MKAADGRLGGGGGGSVKALHLTLFTGGLRKMLSFSKTDTEARTEVGQNLDRHETGKS